jgi:hypothetical protein
MLSDPNKLASIASEVDSVIGPTRSPGTINQSDKTRCAEPPQTQSDVAAITAILNAL